LQGNFIAGGEHSQGFYRNMKVAFPRPFDKNSLADERMFSWREV